MTATTQKRGRRYGSDYARAWSRALHFRDVRTKATLNAICNYVDEDGSCWPSIGTLADDTDQSDDSIRRRLVVLEKCGVLARLPRWRDERGKVNYDENGKRTTDEIRLLFTCTQDDIDAALGIDSMPNSEPESDEFSPSHQQGLNDASPSPQRGSSPSSMRPTPSHCGYPHDEPSLDPNSPQSPPLASAEVAANEPKGTAPYERFAETYGEGSVRPKEARALWEAFDDTERETAIRGARGYRTQRLANKKSLIDPERFLRSRDLWSEFAGAPAANVVELVTVDADADDGRAWRVLHRIAGLPMSQPVEKAGRSLLYLKSAVASAVLALLRAPPEREWGIVAPGDQSFGAWRDFIATHTGRQPIQQQHIVGQIDGTLDKEGKPTFGGYRHKTGIKIPAPFPPRVDGSWPEIPDEIQKAG